MNISKISIMAKLHLFTRPSMEAHDRGIQEAFIRREIDKIVDRKKREGIHPARAKWRELRDVLKEEHWPLLEDMVRRGVITQQNTINYPTYAVDWVAYNKEVEFDRNIAKMLR